MDTTILESVGFEKKEARIYMELLRLGSSPASEIAGHLGEDRTTTYYALLRMLEKGHVSESIQGNVKHFTATPPEQILSLLEERKELFTGLLPSLQELMQRPRQEFTVEVRKGKEGLRHLYRDAIEAGGEVLGMGIDDSQYIAADPAHITQYYEEAEKTGLTERLITYEGAVMLGSSKVTEYRCVPAQYFPPNETIIYADKVVFMVREPSLHIIHIKSGELARSYRKSFELLWENATPPKMQGTRK